jgi:hypothetical protein
MKEILVITEHHDDSFSEPVCTISKPTERPLQVLTEEQYNAVPAVFRCYVCTGRYTQKQIGGFELGQKVCSTCYPWVDEQTVGILIRFDLKHGFPVAGYSVGQAHLEKPKAVFSEWVAEAKARSAQLELDLQKRILKHD